MSKDPYRSSQSRGSAGASDHIDCPGCGARVENSLRHCAACGTPIATVRCASCYHMNLADAEICAGCGQPLGLEPVPEPDELECPDCKIPFHAFEGGPGRLHDCSSCGGQFVDHPLLRDLLAQREVYGKTAPRRPPRFNPLSSPMRYVPCPVCDEMMTRRNFGHSSGVIIDICTPHGVWFDRGELPRVLAFVEAGGLELAKKREALEGIDKARAERLRSFEERLKLINPALHTFNPFERRRQVFEAETASLELLDVIADLMHEKH